MAILFAIVLSCTCVVCFSRNTVSTPELILSFTVCEFEFRSKEEKQAALESKEFIPEKCFLNKVEPYRGHLYIAVPRLFSGVPFSMVEVVKDENGSAKLRPFPNRDIHTLGDCNDIQNCLSMSVDTNTGIMWLIDSGHVTNPDADDPFRASYCPAKIMAMKMRSRNVILKYEFPESVVPAKTNLLDDFVLDYVNGLLAFIYISDATSGTIVVYDVKNHDSFNVKHSSMSADPTATVIPFPNELPPVQAEVGIDGIAMSCDFRYVYYKAFSGYDFYRIPTHELRRGGQDFDAQFEHLGRKNYHVDGMMYSNKHILYSAVMNESALDRWLIGKDACRQGSFENVTMESVQRIAQNDLKMEFVNSIAIDERGSMFTMANRLNRIFQGSLDVTGASGTNFHLWKQKLGRGERSYLWGARHRTATWRKRVSDRN